ASRTAAWTAGATRAVREAWRQARAIERERRERAREAAEPKIDTTHRDDAIVAALPLDLDEGVVDALVASDPAPKKRARKAPARVEAAVDTPAPAPEPAPATDAAPERTRRKGEAAAK